MIQNISQNTRHTIRTLKIDGIAPSNAPTTTLIPSNLERALNGRKALKVRINLKMGISSAPRNDETIPRRATFKKKIYRINFLFKADY